MERHRWVGEFGLIDKIVQIVGRSGAVAGIGDDTAVLDEPGDHYLLATVDMLVEGVHFRRDADAARRLGAKALAVNISDIAAMGGAPTFALTSIALPSDLSPEYVETVYRGMHDMAKQHGVGIVGGNISRAADTIVLDVTLLGRVPKAELILRNGARPGDALVVTGVLGTGAAARALVEAGQQAESAIPVPEPRVETGRRLAEGHLPRAMIDLSDGLGGDLRHLAEASGVGAVIYEEAIPVSVRTRRAAETLGINALDLALFGGEDYELLMALPAERVEEARRAAGPVPLAIVGTVLQPEHGVLLEEIGGRRVSLDRRGWRHF